MRFDTDAEAYKYLGCTPEYFESALEAGGEVSCGDGSWWVMSRVANSATATAAVEVAAGAITKSKLQFAPRPEATAAVATVAAAADEVSPPPDATAPAEAAPSPPPEAAVPTTFEMLTNLAVKFDGGTLQMEVEAALQLAADVGFASELLAAVQSVGMLAGIVPTSTVLVLLCADEAVDFDKTQTLLMQLVPDELAAKASLEFLTSLEGGARLADKTDVSPKVGSDGQDPEGGAAGQEPSPPVADATPTEAIPTEATPTSALPSPPSTFAQATALTPTSAPANDQPFSPPAMVPAHTHLALFSNLILKAKQQSKKAKKSRGNSKTSMIERLSLPLAHGRKEDSDSEFEDDTESDAESHIGKEEEGRGEESTTADVTASTAPPADGDIGISTEEAAAVEVEVRNVDDEAASPAAEASNTNEAEAGGDAETAPTETAPTESAPTETAPTETAPTETAPTESATRDDTAATLPCPNNPPHLISTNHGTVRVSRQKCTLKNAIGSHACSLEANGHVTNGIPLGGSLLLQVCTVHRVQTLKVSWTYQT
jgi:hypothetical protein